jgi:hypothetical protein
MREKFQPAIDALQSELLDLEQQMLETKQVINRLCAKAGIDPLYPDATQSTVNNTLGGLRSDSFYGKAITTAAREFLEMRKMAGLGPATPREIYEALVKGGYTFESKDDTTALIGVRATIRKNSSIFHRLPNGTYGLLSWYPNARPARPDDEDDERPKRANAGTRRKAAKHKGKQRSAPKSEGAGSLTKSSQIRMRLLDLLKTGPKTRGEILDDLKERKLMGSEQNPLANLSAYLSRWRDIVTSVEGGKWAVAPGVSQKETATTH